MVSIYQDFPLTPDMVDEMKLVAADYEPQYGSTLSSAIVAVTKSEIIRISMTANRKVQPTRAISRTSSWVAMATVRTLSAPTICGW